MESRPMSMYDRIKSLSLLRGAANEQIDSFLEKAHLEFDTFETGEIIARQGDSCNSVCCLISGNALLIHNLFNKRLLVQEEVEGGCFIGAERLFGMHTALNYTVKALTRCGTMRFSKAQYIKLLRSDNIFLINYLNLLSHLSQRFEENMRDAEPMSLASLVASIVNVVTRRNAIRIRLESRGEPIAELLGKIATSGGGDFASLVNDGLIELTSDYIISIPDRNALVSAVLD